MDGVTTNHTGVLRTLDERVFAMVDLVVRVRAVPFGWARRRQPALPSGYGRL